MSAERLPRAQARNLVLVRGGRDEADTGDWDDFCHRIGWQGGAHEPDADFERRIAEGLFTKPLAPSNVVDIDRARDARKAPPRDIERALEEMLSRALQEDGPPSFVGRKRTVGPLSDSALEEGDCESSAVRKRVFGAALSAAMSAPGVEDTADEMEPVAPTDVAPEIWSRPSRRTGNFLGAAAVALAVAAAVLFVVAKTVVFSDGSRAASIARPGGAHEIAADPSAIRADDAARNEADRAVNDPSNATSDSTSRATPTARPESPRARSKAPSDGKSVPPGARVARRSKGRRDAETATLPAEPRGRDPMDTDGAVADASSIRSLETLETPEVGARPGFASLRSPLTGFLDRRAARTMDGDRGESTSKWGVPATPRLSLPGVDGAVSPQAVASAWSGAPPAAAPSVDAKAAEPARPATASWSLSGAKDRWVGAAISPSPSQLSAANVGVMVELDLGKALDRL